MILIDDIIETMKNEIIPSGIFLNNVNMVNVYSQSLFQKTAQVDSLTLKFWITWLMVKPPSLSAFIKSIDITQLQMSERGS